MQLNDKVYDILKWIALCVLPAIGTFYFAISQIWGLPYGEEIVGTITAIDTLVGALIGISTSQYNKLNKEQLKAPECRIFLHYSYIQG